MAAKRFLDESLSDPDQQTEKRMRTPPSFASVIREAITLNSRKNFFLALEPLLRRVVNEEVENILKRCSRSLTKSPSLRIEELEQSSLQLMFTKKLCLPIFTGSKIVDVDSKASLQIALVDTKGDHMVLANLPQPIKIEVVVLDGDFPSHDSHTWTSDEYDNNIVKERKGKRPLLAGDCLIVTMRDGIAPIGEIEFTDNSSWIRSRRFRLGARVAPGSSQGLRIREAMTDPFVVKDHRGELYKKHHPPMLEDEVWRLEKIGKDGAFHKKLQAERINTVQDFLKLSTVDPQKLRRILGAGMSERTWEGTMKHARTCVLGNKHYIFRGSDFSITLNPVCQVVNAMIDGQTYSARDLSSINRSYIENLVRKAHAEWRSLEEVVAIPSETPLLTQGEQADQYCHPQQAMVKSFHQSGYAADAYVDVGTLTSNAHLGYNNWQFTSTYQGAPSDPGVGYTMSESSSDGEYTSSRTYINGN